MLISITLPAYKLYLPKKVLGETAYCITFRVNYQKMSTWNLNMEVTGGFYSGFY